MEQLVGPVRARVQVHFAPVGAQARAEVLAALDSERYFALLDELDQVIAEPDLQPKASWPAGDVLPAQVRPGDVHESFGGQRECFPARAWPPGERHRRV